MKMYIAVLDEVPDHMVPVLVAHTVLNAHFDFISAKSDDYTNWLIQSFRKVVLRVNSKEFAKIAKLPMVHLGQENTVLNRADSCIVVCPRKEYQNVIKFAKMWKPNHC